jgi:hypothetical protein
MSDYTISGMIDAANRASPSEFQDAFKNLVLDKISTAIEIKKNEIAQNYFASSNETEQNTENETSETDYESEENEENQDEET